MVNKFLSGVALSATIIAGNVATVSANTTNVKTGNGVTVNSVAPKSSLVEFGGRTLTDAEAAKVEGEALPLALLIPVAGKIATATATKAAVVATKAAAVSGAKKVGGVGLWIAGNEAYAFGRKQFCDRWGCRW